MTAKVKSIEIKAFRGIPDLNILLDGKGLLVLGENGTGKSSIVEAFEFFFTGLVSHLEGTQGISSTHHAPHVNYTGDDVSVSISFDPGNIKLTRSFNSQPNPPKFLLNYFDCASRGSFILKRSQILQFITSRPADRFRSIASIIGVDNLDEIELEMMRNRDELIGQVNAENQEISQIFNTLSYDLNSTITSTDEVLPALNLILRNSNFLQIANLDDIQSHAEEMLKSLKSVESIEKVANLNQYLSQVSGTLFPNNFIEQMSNLINQAKPLLDQKIQTKLKLLELLRIGKQFIIDEKLTKCPLCEQPIERDKLISQVTQRMNIIQSLDKNNAKLRELAASLTAIIESSQSRVIKLRSNLMDINYEGVSLINLIYDNSFFNKYLTAIKKIISLEENISFDNFKQDLNNIENQWSYVSKKLNDEIQELGITEEEKHFLEIVRLIGRVKEKVEKLNKTKIHQISLITMRDLARTIYYTFSETKRTKVSQIYDKIQDDIRKYYSILHPNEAHTDVTLRLRPGQRASTELRIKSFGRNDEDPRAFTSEGHLDSLGLCIFLAFVRNFNTDCSLIILDDVVTTIDSGHRTKICDMLFNEFKEYQIIITTHDEIWCRELTASQRAFNLENYFLNLKITSWSLENGPYIDKIQPRIDIIKERIISGDKTGAGNGARQYLEWLLKQIAIKTNTSVPVVSWQSVIVGDLISSVKARMVNLVKDPVYISRLQDAFANLERTMFFGNLLSHDNALADQISLNEVDKFFQTIQELHNIVSCPSCTSLLEYYNNVGEYRCGNKRCQQPLIMSTK